MNKNTVIAFLLIALVVIVFNSAQWNKFWYGTILKKPVPTVVPPAQRAAAKESAAKEATEMKIRLPDEKPADAGASSTAASTAAADGADGTKIVDPNAAADSAAALAQIVEDTVIVETNRIIAAISTKGGRIISLKAKDYKYAVGLRKDQIIDLLPQRSVGGAQLSLNNESFDDRFFSASVSPDGYTVTLEAKTSSGRSIRKVFTFADDAYKIGYAVVGDGVAGQMVTLGWAGGIEDSEATPDVPFGGEMDRRRAHYSDGRTVYHREMNKKDLEDEKKKGVENPSGTFRWVGMSSKYFFAAIVADTLHTADIRIKGRNATGKQAAAKDKKAQDIDYSVYYTSEASTDSVAAWIYAGPSKVGELSQYHIKFDKTLFPVLSWARHIFWADLWFPPIAEIILKLLLYLHQLFKDYGIAILLLTLLSKVVTYPLTQSSNKSMMRMRDLQPKVAALRQKYGKANPQKFNEEMMALYKAEGVNPFNPGCLPMFLQMPIFIALFVVLRKAIELRSATTYLLPWVQDLSLPEALFTLPFAIPFYGSNVALMPILMAALTFFQQKMSIQDPNQKMMIYVMPVIMLVLFNGFPAGVVFYWTMSSAFGVVQQKWLLPKPSAPVAAAATVGAAQASGAAHHKSPVKRVSHGGKRRSSKKR